MRQQHVAGPEKDAVAARAPGGTAAAPAAHPQADPAPAPALPPLSLPRGGGALRGIGEKFTANPATGTSGLTIPLAVTPGRGGFSPELSLSYDSGAGNGPFGLGWRLSVPSISRKTEKGLPRYRDGDDGDTFLLSGAEDLVPALVRRGTEWVRHEDPAADPVVTRYRPRVEGGFARIERVRDRATGEVHWRTVSRDNVTRLYGRTPASRLADPADPTRVFEWLLDEARDDRGNRVVYEYRAEDLAGVTAAAAHEAHRVAGVARCANRYLKRVWYGNQTPYAPGAPAPGHDDWLFTLVFDYGEHAADRPGVHDDRARPWTVRADPFSACRAGFEVRTYRLCRRVLMFHHFPAELSPGPCLVRSTALEYRDDPAHAFLVAVTHAGHVRDAAGTYTTRALPPLELGYTEGVLHPTVRTVPAESLEGAPAGLADERYRWVDLDGEGLAGLLTEQGGAWWYKRNHGGGVLAPPERVDPVPSAPLLAAGRQLLELGGEGQLCLVDYAGPAPGFWEREEDGGWAPHRPFPALPNLAWDDPALRWVDLDGDGVADLLVPEGDAFRWYPSLAREGFAPPETVAVAAGEARGPRLVFADPVRSVHLADMNGDGLADLVRVRAGEVCYWPSLGHGRFGARVTMSRAPVLDHPGRFDPRRVRLADVDGSGTADLVYLGDGFVSLWTNQAGNGWGLERRIDPFPVADPQAEVQVIDLLGTGTACLAWSSALPGHAGRALRYVELTGGVKPHLLERVDNSMGAVTRIGYAPSTRFYLADRREDRPWATRLPFPVQVVERVEVHDGVSGSVLRTRYAYHHGFYDRAEREFRGFGMVEQWDAEERAPYAGVRADGVDAEDLLRPVPVLTRAWFHTGAWLEGERIAGRFRRDYHHGAATALPDSVLPPGLSARDEREACRALKGLPLRQEVYAADGTALATAPYTVSEQSYGVRLVQPRGGGRHAVFLAFPRESLAFHYERDLADPRVVHELALAVDEWGNVTRAATVAYPRRPPAAGEPPHPPEHTRLAVTCTESLFTAAVDRADAYRAPLPAETSTWELTGAAPRAGGRFGWGEVADAVEDARRLDPEEAPDGGVCKRLLDRVRHRYWRDDLRGVQSAAPDALEAFAHGFGDAGTRAALYQSYRLALTPGLRERLFAGRVDDAALREGGYLFADGGWWAPSGRAVPDPERFHLLTRAVDPFGNTSSVEYDAYALLPRAAVDPLGSRVEAENDYRVLSPALVTDANGNRAAAAFDALGMVAGTAVMGKAGERAGDSLEGFAADSDPALLRALWRDPLADPHTLLARATTRIVYDVDRYRHTRRMLPDGHEQGEPAGVLTLARETHDAALAPGERTRVQVSVGYTDGFGRPVQAKARAEPGGAPARGADGSLLHAADGTILQVHTAARWVGTGRTVYDAKGRPVKQYEPFFSATHGFETERELVETGVTPVLRYDPVGRLVRTDHPDGTLTRVAFGPWRQETWDAGDTVREGGWQAPRQAPGAAAEDARAAELALAYAGTPAAAHLDVLGRPFLAVEDNGRGEDGARRLYATHVELDIQGNARAVTDARGNRALAQDFDLLGRPLSIASADAGERRVLPDVAAKPVRAWDARGHAARTVYDALRRPVEVWVAKAAGAEPGDAGHPERLVERTVYGESHPDRAQAVRRNLRGRPFLQHDSAGVVAHEEYDFKGNPLRAVRQVAEAYRTAPSWAGPVPLLEGDYAVSTEYDALNRPARATEADGSVVERAFNEAGLLERVAVRIRGAAAATPFVRGIDYDAKGRRARIDYAGGVETEYAYDPLTSRLIRLHTTGPGGPLQDLRYTYDPSGNVMEVRDLSQPATVWSGERVEARWRYAYDALYRLTGAEGREHAAQTGYAPAAPRDLFRDYPFAGPHAHDGEAMRGYAEAYDYDAVGNLLWMRHTARGGSWTRRYEYEPGCNRLRSTSLPGDADDAPLPVRYRHDAHGSMLAMPHLPSLAWDHGDQLARAELGGGGTAWYVYDGAGERVRKVVERPDGTREERLYLGACEIYLRRDSAGGLRRETLHVLDDLRRIALVETRTDPAGAALADAVIRFQLEDHLGSASVETDAAGAVISREEYHPYGTTSFQAHRPGEISLKRYRYTGKESDEETGLAYHSARYYAPWLGRWTSADPAGMVDGPNLYAYCRSNPVRHTDPDGHQTLDEDMAQVRQAVAASETIVSACTERIAEDIDLYNSALQAWTRTRPGTQAWNQGRDQVITFQSRLLEDSRPITRALTVLQGYAPFVENVASRARAANRENEFSETRRSFNTLLRRTRDLDQALSHFYLVTVGDLINGTAGSGNRGLSREDLEMLQELESLLRLLRSLGRGGGGGGNGASGAQGAQGSRGSQTSSSGQGSNASPQGRGVRAEVPPESEEPAVDATGDGDRSGVETDAALEGPRGQERPTEVQASRTRTYRIQFDPTNALYGAGIGVAVTTVVVIGVVAIVYAPEAGAVIRFAPLVIRAAPAAARMMMPVARGAAPMVAPLLGF